MSSTKSSRNRPIPTKKNGETEPENSPTERSDAAEVNCDRNSADKPHVTRLMQFKITLNSQRRLIAPKSTTKKLSTPATTAISAIRTESSRLWNTPPKISPDSRVNTEPISYFTR